MTTEQLAVLAADPLISATPDTPDGAAATAAVYNAPADPVWWVWRSALAPADVLAVIVWPEYIARAAGEREAFGLLVSAPINPATATIRQAFADIFSGASGAATRAALLAVSRRPATRAERLLSVGVGTEQAPATLGYEGAVGLQDIQAARAVLHG